MKRRAWISILLSLLLALAACDDDKKTNATNNGQPANNGENNENNGENNGTNNGENNGVNNGVNNDRPPTGAYVDAKTAPVDETLALDGLRYPVHVSVDEWGIPHILAESLDDALFVQGYLHARDRLAQMELFRRSTNGTLAEVAGAISPGTISDDIFQRVIGFRRVAQKIHDSIAPGSDADRVLNAYASGVNAYIAKVRSGEASVPRAAQTLVSVNALQDWDPLDSLVLMRFQQYNLSFDAFTEIRLTQARLGLAASFPADSDDPRLAARARIMEDMFRWAPADATYQVPGFTTAQTKTNQNKDLQSGAALKLPSASLLERSARAVSGPYSALMDRVKIPEGMSNSWVVAGSKTDSGHAMLANDPHLSLDSPALFHQVHFVVEPATEADGPAINAMGAIFPGLPGILIGHNERVAWGLTTAGYDYTDVYREQLVWRDGEEWPRVLHNGEEVELEIVEEEVRVGAFGNITETITVKIPVVPHHGPLSPVIDGRELARPEGEEALSIAWTGFMVSNEVDALLGFMKARNVDDVKASLGDWVIGTQNLVFADVEGNIFKTGESFIPQRPEAARDYHPQDNPTGAAPWFVLDGTGAHDWEGALDRARVPQVRDPEVGYIATANNDQAGVTDDNDPLNDASYLGYDFDLGFRAGRIERLLKGEAGEFEPNHKYSLEELGRIQTDSFSNLGERLAPVYVALLERALEEAQAPGTHADIAEVVAAHPEDMARLMALRDLLAGWDFEADDGLTGEPSAERIQSSGATSLFNFWTTALLLRTFNDERAAAPDLRPTSQQEVKALLWIVERPADTATLNPQTGHSALWDDLGTAEVEETRGWTMLTALFDALAALNDSFGSDDPADWRWGRLHKRTFESLIPAIGGGQSSFTLPRPEEAFPEGYPRAGDNFNVDACNGGLGRYRYDCGGGAIMRFLVDLDPDGVRSFNAQPGGQVWDPASPHFRDTLDVWLANERYLLRFHPQDVAQGTEAHLLFRAP
jgi:penicillin amidase